MRKPPRPKRLLLLGTASYRRGGYPGATEIAAKCGEPVYDLCYWAGIAAARAAVEMDDKENLPLVLEALGLWDMLREEADGET